jgi:hypothetical protein
MVVSTQARGPPVFVLDAGGKCPCVATGAFFLTSKHIKLVFASTAAMCCRNQLASLCPWQHHGQVYHHRLLYPTPQPWHSEPCAPHRHIPHHEDLRLSEGRRVRDAEKSE